MNLRWVFDSRLILSVPRQGRAVQFWHRYMENGQGLPVRQGRGLVRLRNAFLSRNKVLLCDWRSNWKKWQRQSPSYRQIYQWRLVSGGKVELGAQCEFFRLFLNYSDPNNEVLISLTFGKTLFIWPNSLFSNSHDVWNNLVICYFSRSENEIKRQIERLGRQNRVLNWICE